MLSERDKKIYTVSSGWERLAYIVIYSLPLIFLFNGAYSLNVASELAALEGMEFTSLLSQWSRGYIGDQTYTGYYAKAISLVDRAAYSVAFALVALISAITLNLDRRHKHHMSKILISAGLLKESK
jgi:hypothetical protein